MELTSVHLLYSFGIVVFICMDLCTSIHPDYKHSLLKAFNDKDDRTRHKRDISDSNTGNDITTGVNVDILASVTPSPPAWIKEIRDNKWYGYNSYTGRDLYKKDPTKKPTVCFNNASKVENDTVTLNHFVCPMANQTSGNVYCCGAATAQICCKVEAYNKQHNITDDGVIDEFDLATGIGIGVGFVLSISFCMFLYCCCCQRSRRPEIHNNIKLMWVRRSFGKEINRLEQPTYPNHLAIVSSRAGSRAGSRQGSRAASRQGSRNPSRGPSPSVSRRASNEPQSPTGRKRQVSNSSEDKHHLTLNVPNSAVMITVTTPSDEHGPTDPLLKKSVINQDNDTN